MTKKIVNTLLSLSILFLLVGTIFFKPLPVNSWPTGIIIDACCHNIEACCSDYCLNNPNSPYDGSGSDVGDLIACLRDCRIILVHDCPGFNL